MTQEERELLLKDLCARLPYGVKVSTVNHAVEFGIISGISIENKISVRTKHADIVFDCEEIKPYLRPPSSMTEEELREFQDIEETCQASFYPTYCHTLVDWLDKKMIAYRRIGNKDMFELDLAVKAPEGMY